MDQSLRVSVFHDSSTATTVDIVDTERDSIIMTVRKWRGTDRGGAVVSWPSVDRATQDITLMMIRVMMGCYALARHLDTPFATVSPKDLQDIFDEAMAGNAVVPILGLEDE